jgi:hypothetical protein
VREMRGGGPQGQGADQQPNQQPCIAARPGGGKPHAHGIDARYSGLGVSLAARIRRI